MADYAWIIPTLPAVAFFVILLLGKRLPRGGDFVGIAAISGSLVIAIGVLVQAFQHAGGGEHPFVVEKALKLVDFGGGELTLGMKVDGLAAAMFIVVCVVSLLVQVYSTSYMHGDKRYTFFFAILSMFTTGMLLVTIADNLLLMLVGWEIMGVCSYFLIGHYWEEQPNSNAAIKAFLTTRIGDVGFMLGIATLFIGAHSFKLTEIIEAAEQGHMSHGYVVAGTLLLFCGAIGKSAQFPLHVWLPDAMAGPTPVSALIHAATMVASGIYMVCRLYPVFELSGPALNMIGILAAITMLMAALIALVQDDIKKVLAYSTVSQLAYMTAGLSVGGYTAGFFHLFTHAAFKALLFLGAGSVIHAVGTNNMSEMGGLRKFMPRTHATFLIGSLTLAGLFPLAAFWSKDEVIVDACRAAGVCHSSEHLATSPMVGKLVFAVTLVTALLTAFYTIRMYCLTFRGTYRGKTHPHESPAAMTVPLMVLAVPAALLGLLGSPLLKNGAYFGKVIAFAGQEVHPPHIHLALGLTSFALFAVGAGVGYAVYGKGLPRRDPTLNMGFATTLFANKFYLDDLYMNAFVRPIRDRVATAANWWNQNVFDAPPNLLGRAAISAGRGAYSVDQHVVDGAVNGSGRTADYLGRGLRLLQNGNVQAYATAMFIGIVALAVVFSAR
ncbi:MAG: NADH-quinone oxidoreductase subunit [Frankiaceae bacterium]|nr:NADH-quinone oxidoreductase subunit [Frankiaceae bacterium]